jgi:hypothetical protein
MSNGYDRQIIGNEGEHLFGVLAARWGAIWTNTREAAAVDGWLSWPDLPGVILWVQVKSRRELGTKGPELRIRIPNADTLADWSAREPILAVPVFDENEAFWIDTAEHLPKPPPLSFTFRVPLLNAVSRTPKATIRRIALSRRRSLSPLEVPGPTWFRSARRTVWQPSLPGTLASITSLSDLVLASYREMDSLDIIGRDANALAVARLLVGSPGALLRLDSDLLLDAVSVRLLSSAWGGRSFTLGALASLFRPDTGVSFGGEVIDRMIDAAEWAIAKRTLLNPEFGLIILAELVERFPTRSTPRDALASLTEIVVHDPQNKTLLRIARRLRAWLDADKRPLSTVVPKGWLEQAAFRPLPSDSEVMADPEAAVAAVQHVLAYGIEGSSTSQLQMVDHVVRKKAEEVMRKWL